jgi:hypothetical protein
MLYEVLNETPRVPTKLLVRSRAAGREGRSEYESSHLCILTCFFSSFAELLDTAAHGAPLKAGSKRRFSLDPLSRSGSSANQLTRSTNDFLWSLFPQ